MNEILAHLADNGLTPGELTLDGKIHRFQVDNKDTKKSGWYVGYSNFTRKSGENFYVVTYGNYKTGDTFKFISDGIKLSPEDKKALKEQLSKAKKLSDELRIIQQEQVSHDVQAKWDSLSDTGVSDYLNKKQIADCKDLGIKFSPKEGFYVPMRDIDGKLWSVQKIQNDGGKFFFPGGRVEGCFHVIGNINKSETLYLCEGFATGASIHMALDMPIVISFNSGNLPKVAKLMKDKHSSKTFIICGDDDRDAKKPDGMPYNPGRESAEEAARLCLGKAIFPRFET